MRGKKRKVANAHAQLGWFYSGVQAVVREWSPILSKLTMVKTFDGISFAMQVGYGPLRVELQGPSHRRFLCELMVALKKLYDRENAAGWILRLCRHPECPTLLSAREIKDLPSLEKKLHHAQDSVSRFLSERLPEGVRKLLNDDKELKKGPIEERKRSMVKALNGILQQGYIYEAQRFAKVTLRPETREQLVPEWELRDQYVLPNRMLLEDAYPQEISKSAYPYKPQRRKRIPLLSYAQMANEIVARGGPEFTEEALRKEAQRLRLTDDPDVVEHSVYEQE